MSRLTRRQALSAAVGATAGLAATGAAYGTAQAAAHAAALSTGQTEAAGSRRAVRAAAPGSFDEVYKGRRIQGEPSRGAPRGGHEGHHGAHHGGGYTVRIDGDELHVMSNADGTWISVVNHYEPQATPRALARAAVLDLQGAVLVPLALS
ncbi:apotyrosinase chaperone MelC1 [Streptomyces hypolithicus]